MLAVMFVCVVLLVYLGAFVGGLVCNVFKACLVFLCVKVMQVCGSLLFGFVVDIGSCFEFVIYVC